MVSYSSSGRFNFEEEPPRYPLRRSPGAPHSRSTPDGEDKIFSF